MESTSWEARGPGAPGCVSLGGALPSPPAPSRALFRSLVAARAGLLVAVPWSIPPVPKAGAAELLCETRAGLESAAGAKQPSLADLRRCRGAVLYPWHEQPRGGTPVKYRVPRAVCVPHPGAGCCPVLPSRRDWGYPPLVSRRCSVSLAARQPPRTPWARLWCGGGSEEGACWA